MKITDEQHGVLEGLITAALLHFKNGVLPDLEETKNFKDEERLQVFCNLIISGIEETLNEY
ncbi:MAG: hypothetical protein GY804_15030 [Alphaproteobacteria bacterium]|nr:hypothetical protein [Alphaproteobacteria bacterium]